MTDSRRYACPIIGCGWTYLSLRVSNVVAGDNVVAINPERVEQARQDRDVGILEAHVITHSPAEFFDTVIALGDRIGRMANRIYELENEK